MKEDRADELGMVDGRWQVGYGCSCRQYSKDITVVLGQEVQQHDQIREPTVNSQFIEVDHR